MTTGPAHLSLTLLGVGALHSPRYAPAGLLLAGAGSLIAIDGGPGAAPPRRLDAWLVTDDHGELRGKLRRLAADRGLQPTIAAYHQAPLSIEPNPVAHTAHPTVGYLIRFEDRQAAWAPKFWTFPQWTSGVDLLFADATAWNRPIRFAHGVGGHAAALDVAREAQRQGVRRLVFARIGQATIRALDAGDRPQFGEIGRDRARYRL